jgi:transposase InsO family protein
MKNRFRQAEKSDILSFIDHLKEMTGASTSKLVKDLGLNKATFYNWLKRREAFRLEDHKPVGRNPKALLPWERQAIIDYYLKQDDHYKGYARLCYEMIDADVVYSSPSTVYRVLSKAGLLMRWAPARKLGDPPAKPDAPNQKWHTDLMQINIGGRIYYYQGVIDAYSRYIISYDIHTEGTALNTSLVLQSAFDKSPRGIKPFIVSDNGPEFISKEFREVIRQNNGVRMRISAYHPQSNGIDERHHRTLREECLYGKSPENLFEIKEIVGKWVDQYNNKRLHSAIRYMPPAVWHAGKQQELLKERKNKLKMARKERRNINLKQLNRVVS